MGIGHTEKRVNETTMAIPVPESQRALYRSLGSAQRRLDSAREQGNHAMIEAYRARVQDIREKIGQASASRSGRGHVLRK